MLLRRITKHVKDQNWLAVGIDFLIVVIGVFIGIQVANWNEGRQAETANRLYLDRIAKDVESDISRLQDSQAGWASIIARSADSEQFLSGDDVPGKSQWTSLVETYFSAGWSPYAPNRTTYDELVASGQFAGLGDLELRQAITNYYSSLKETERFYNFNPRLRSLIRGKFDTSLQAYMWEACYSDALFREIRDGVTSCQAPDATMPLEAITSALRADPNLLEEFRFTHSIRLIAQTIAEEDIRRAEVLSLRIGEYRQ